MEVSSDRPKLRGRPRSFDRDAALDIAMRLFWTRGYEATSINDLATAMAIKPPSLYAAFGDKKRLFAEAVARYKSGPGGFVARAMADAPSARQAVENVLLAAVDVYTDPTYPRGCMVIHAASNCAAEADDIVADLAALRASLQMALRQRIAAGMAAGDVPDTVDPVALSAFYAAVMQGMSGQARDGARHDHLRGIALSAMRAWPT